MQRPSDDYKNLGMTDCLDGYRDCGGTTENTDYCVSDSELCPINDIQIFEPGTPIPADEFEEVTNFANGYILATSRTANRLPLVQFKYTEKAVCSDKNEIE